MNKFILCAAACLSGLYAEAGQEFSKTSLTEQGSDIGLHMTTKQSFSTACPLQVEQIRISRDLGDDLTASSPTIEVSAACDPNAPTLAVAGPSTLDLYFTRGASLPKILGTFELQIHIRGGSAEVDLDGGFLTVDKTSVEWNVDGMKHKLPSKKSP